MISAGSNFVYFNYPVTFAIQANSVVLTHMNTDHGVRNSSIYLESIRRCALYGESKFDSDTKFYIIAIGA